MNPRIHFLNPRAVCNLDYEHVSCSPACTAPLPSLSMDVGRWLRIIDGNFSSDRYSRDPFGTAFSVAPMEQNGGGGGGSGFMLVYTSVQKGPNPGDWRL